MVMQSSKTSIPVFYPTTLFRRYHGVLMERYSLKILVTVAYKMKSFPWFHFVSEGGVFNRWLKIKMMNFDLQKYSKDPFKVCNDETQRRKEN